jgi:nucleotide-binding universal stress UspA family protein
MNDRGAVVVGLGDSREAMPELAWAAREAQARKRPLHILRAYHLSQGALPWESSIDRSIVRQMRRAAELRVRTAVGHVHAHWPGIDVQGHAIDGLAWDVLCEAARSAELTVVGSRHHGALGAAVLGSVSTVVAARAPGVVVVAGNPPGDPAEDPTVVVGVDGSEGTDDVLAFAFEYASRHQRPLHAVFCWSPDLLATMQWRVTPPPPDRADRWLAEAVAGWQDKYPDVRVRRGVIREYPVAGLVAESLSQELLVVGSHSTHARAAALLGSVSQGVLHHATCPVAVVHRSAMPRADA